MMWRTLALLAGLIFCGHAQAQVSAPFSQFPPGVFQTLATQPSASSTSLSVTVPSGTNSAAIGGTPTLPTNFGSTNFDISTASADRIVAVAIQWKGAASTLPNTDIDCSVGNVKGNGGAITFSQGAHYYNASLKRGTNVCYALVTTGTTMTIEVTSGSGTGWVEYIHVEILVIKGSAAASVASVQNASPPGYGGGVPAAGAITDPTGGVAIISSTADDITAIVTWSGTTSASSDIAVLTDSVTDGVSHAVASATVSQAYAGSGTAGWAAVVFQP